MRLTYHITLSDGKKIDVLENSAGDAMGKAINEYPGRTVTDCFWGDKTKGFISYEVPPHQAIAETHPRATKGKDGTESFEFFASVPVTPKSTAKRKSA